MSNLLLVASNPNRYSISFSFKGSGITTSKFDGWEMNRETNEIIIHYEYNGFAKGKVTFIPTTANFIVASWREMEEGVVGAINSFFGNVLSDVVSGNGYFEVETDSGLILRMKGEWGDKGFTNPSKKEKKGSWELIVR